MSMKETDRRWLPAERDALASEAIGGPSLTMDRSAVLFRHSRCQQSCQ